MIQLSTHRRDAAAQDACVVQFVTGTGEQTAEGCWGLAIAQPSPGRVGVQASRRVRNIFRQVTQLTNEQVGMWRARTERAITWVPVGWRLERRGMSIRACAGHAGGRLRCARAIVICVTEPSDTASHRSVEELLSRAQPRLASAWFQQATRATVSPRRPAVHQRLPPPAACAAFYRRLCRSPGER
jgi:hypothetical protein